MSNPSAIHEEYVYQATELTNNAYETYLLHNAAPHVNEPLSGNISESMEKCLSLNLASGGVADSRFPVSKTILQDSSIYSYFSFCPPYNLNGSLACQVQPKVRNGISPYSQSHALVLQ